MSYYILLLKLATHLSLGVSVNKFVKDNAVSDLLAFQSFTLYYVGLLVIWPINLSITLQFN